MNGILAITAASAVSGGMTAGILYGYGRGAKKSIGRGALMGGLVAALIAAGTAAVGYYMLGSSSDEGSVSGLGLISTKFGRVRRLGRMGAYMPEPTVKKFSSFTGTRYYS
jgi:hypothetical protein